MRFKVGDIIYYKVSNDIKFEVISTIVDPTTSILIYHMKHTNSTATIQHVCYWVDENFEYDKIIMRDKKLQSIL